MSIFDRLLKPNQVPQVAQTPTQAAAKKETFTFTALPESLEQLQALPEAELRSPFQAAALTVCALCAYGADPQVGTQMLNWLIRSIMLPGPVRLCPAEWTSAGTDGISPLSGVIKVVVFLTILRLTRR